MKNGEEKERFQMFWKKRRFIIALFLFFGMFMSFNLRVNLSVAIVKMTENQTIVDANGTVHYDSEFEWNSKQKGFILGAFYYGYMTTQLLGGWLAGQIGGKWVFGLGIGIAAFLAIFTPPIARYNVDMFIALRVLQGISEGMTYPAINAIWAYWAPPLERSKLSSYVMTGSSVGTFLSMPICGVMAERFGWPSIFYTFGTIGIIWFILLLVFVQNRPEEDPRISQNELEYIKNSLESTKSYQRVKYPWRQILTSAPAWAIFLSHVCESWGMSTMVIMLPIFMNDILGLNLEKGGIYSALPYIATTLMVLGTGYLSDYLRSRAILTITQIRKLAITVGFVGQSIFIALAAWFMTEPAIIIPSIVLGVGFGGIAFSGFHVNYLDIAPRYSSLIAGIGNTLACIPSIISPISIGYIVQNQSVEEWRIVFLIICGFYILGSIIYGIIGSSEVQSWADEKRQDSTTSCDNPTLQVED